MDTPKTLAARLRDIVRSGVFPHEAGAKDGLLSKAADYLERLPAPDVGVGLTRYDSAEDQGYTGLLREHPEGEWVRYEDVAPLLAAARAVPADVVLATTGEMLKDLALISGPTYGRTGLAIQAILHDDETMRAALAASTAREKAKDAEIAGLREALEPFAQYARAVGKGLSDDSLIIGITSNGVEAAIYMGDCRRVAALAREPAKEGT